MKLRKDTFPVDKNMVHASLLYVLVMNDGQDERQRSFWLKVNPTCEVILKLANLLMPRIKFNPVAYKRTLCVIVRPELLKRFPQLKDWDPSEVKVGNFENWVAIHARRDLGDEWIEIVPINIPYQGE